MAVMDYVPQTSLLVAELAAVAAAEEQVFSQLKAQLEGAFEDAFILTAGTEALSVYEKELGIIARAGEDLDFRRQRLINRYTSKPPFTVNWLRERLDALLGAGWYDVIREIEEQKLTISAGVDTEALFKEFMITLERTVPLDMALEVVEAQKGVIRVWPAAAYYEYEFIWVRQEEEYV